MRSHLFFLLMTSLLAAGCGMGKNATSSFTTVGTSIGAIPTDTKVEPGGTISLSSNPLTIEKGKTAMLKILAERKDTKIEKMFKGEIKLEFDTSDAKGIRIEPATIPAGQESVEVIVTAAADADPGGMIKVVGKGAGVDPFTFYIRPTIR